jgi:hypothetical protein
MVSGLTSGEEPSSPEAPPGGPYPTTSALLLRVRRIESRERAAASWSLPVAAAFSGRRTKSWAGSTGWCTPAQACAWLDAYAKALKDAKTDGGQVTVSTGDYGPLPVMMSALLQSARVNSARNLWIREEVVPSSSPSMVRCWRISTNLVTAPSCIPPTAKYEIVAVLSRQ